MDTTNLQFTRQRNGEYGFVPPHTIAVAKPEDGVLLTITGSQKVNPPADSMSSEEMRAWLNSLHDSGYTFQARDGYGHLLPIELDAE